MSTNPSNPKLAFAVVVDVGLLPRVKVQRISVDARRHIIWPPGPFAGVAPVPCVANADFIVLILCEEPVGHLGRQLPPIPVIELNLDHRLVWRVVPLAAKRRPIYFWLHYKERRDEKKRHTLRSKAKQTREANAQAQEISMALAKASKHSRGFIRFLRFS